MGSIGIADAVESSLDDFQLRCCDVHPVRCQVDLRSTSVAELLERACIHGATAHGFTPVWYTPARRARMAAAIAGRAPSAADKPGQDPSQSGSESGSVDPRTLVRG